MCWSDDCVLDSNITTGQNLAGGYANWEDALNSWYGEKKVYRYGRTNKKTVGHYTQVSSSQSYP